MESEGAEETNESHRRVHHQKEEKRAADKKAAAAGAQRERTNERSVVTSHLSVRHSFAISFRRMS